MKASLVILANWKYDDTKGIFFYFACDMFSRNVFRDICFMSIFVEAFIILDETSGLPITQSIVNAYEVSFFCLS